MTSSFGNVIGTPRDQLPDISKTNYLKTDADLAESVNAEIDKQKEDTKRYYDQMVEIEKNKKTFIDFLFNLVVRVFTLSVKVATLVVLL